MIIKWKTSKKNSTKKFMRPRKNFQLTRLQNNKFRLSYLWKRKDTKTRKDSLSNLMQSFNLCIKLWMKSFQTLKRTSTQSTKKKNSTSFIESNIYKIRSKKPKINQEDSLKSPKKVHKKLWPSSKTTLKLKGINGKKGFMTKNKRTTDLFKV